MIAGDLGAADAAHACLTAGSRRPWSGSSSNRSASAFHVARMAGWSFRLSGPFCEHARKIVPVEALILGCNATFWLLRAARRRGL
jgi:hypothetical protein